MFTICVSTKAPAGTCSTPPGAPQKSMLTLVCAFGAGCCSLFLTSIQIGYRA